MKLYLVTAGNGWNTTRRAASAEDALQGVYDLFVAYSRRLPDLTAFLVE